MSDLRPKGVKITFEGEERKLLFTLSVIDNIQDTCNKGIFDAIMSVANIADGHREKDTLWTFIKIFKCLLDEDGGPAYTEEEISHMINLGNLQDITIAILEAYGVSIPDPDEEEEDEEDADPKVEAG